MRTATNASTTWVAGTYVVVVDKAASPGMTSGGRSSTGVSSDMGSTGDGTDHGRDVLVSLDRS